MRKKELSKLFNKMHESKLKILKQENTVML
jgi:hypothetical protein